MSHEAKPIENEHFRDTISTIDDKSGDRAWVYAKKPNGKIHNIRSIFSIGLMALMFSGPFIKLNGHQMLLLNILDRKFIILGIPFWPQDLPLFALLMITFVVFIIVFTVLFGRMWCGWTCPQTVFMEMLFRKIEYLIEGDYRQQMKLDESPISAEKIFKKSIKHIVFFLLSVFIANIFLAYLIGSDEVLKLVTDGPKDHMGQFISLVIFSTVFYAVFSKFREIVCIVICPYGRLQGLMLDKNSIVVAYDYIRGEPRGHIRKNTDQNHLGDCIDCKRCVHVCPTGIDIRNGTQLECVNCTACIDECDDVMKKIDKPTGLVRYASQDEIVNKLKRRVTVRSAAYVVILCLLVTALSYFLITRKDVDATVLRTPGMLFQNQNEGRISNMYNYEVVNKTFTTQKIMVKVVQPAKAELKMVDRELNGMNLNEDALVKGSFFIILPEGEIKSNNTEVTIQVLSNGKLMDEIRTNFVGPVFKK
ncbi:MAG: cytochrome c oxidase accessory protein CcoG [Bacteroidota bacterium]